MKFFFLSFILGLSNLLHIYYSTDLSNLIKIPLKEIQGKLFLDIQIGSNKNNISLLIDTVSSYSWLINRTEPKYNTFNNSTEFENYYYANSSSYNSINGIPDNDFDKFYLSTNLSISKDKFSFSEENIYLINMMNKDNFEINKFWFALKNIESEDSYSGGISLARHYQKGEESFSIIKHIKKNNIAQGEDFRLVRTNHSQKIRRIQELQDTIHNENENFITDFNPYLEIGNNQKNLDDNLVYPFCNLFQYDILFSYLWACNISHIYVNDLSEYKKVTNFTEDAIFVNSYALIDTTIDYIIIPKTQIVSIKNSMNSNNKLDLNIFEYFDRFLLNSTCEIYNLTEARQTFLCEYESNNLQGFLNKLNFYEISFVLNGYGISLTSNKLFRLYRDSKINSSKYYFIFNIEFYSTQSDLNFNLWILGNLFLKEFDSILFSESAKKIVFKTEKFYNFTDFTSDIKENNPLFSVLFLSVICVILLVLIVIIVPYYIYRKRRRALMEKLHYDIIYKKMDDITKDLSA
jgi:hypothetical protein